jgi:hypothetical protein
MIELITNDDPHIAAVSSFIDEIELIRNNKQIHFMDAVLVYCERNEIELETIAKFIRNNVILKSKIQEEAEELNYLKKTTKLMF